MCLFLFPFFCSKSLKKRGVSQDLCTVLKLPKMNFDFIPCPECLRIANHSLPLENNCNNFPHSYISAEHLSLDNRDAGPGPSVEPTTYVIPDRVVTETAWEWQNWLRLNLSGYSSPKDWKKKKKHKKTKQKALLWGKVSLVKIFVVFKKFFDRMYILCA